MKFAAILLLGVALGQNDMPTAELRSRVKKAAAVYRRLGGKVPVMPCGGYTRGHQRTEAEVMTELLLAEGVPIDAIRMEGESRTTVENFRNALALLGRDARVLIVTSDYHVRRAIRTARRVGLRARGVGAPLPHDELWRCNRILEIRWSIELRRGWLDYPGARPEEGRLRMEARFGKYKERRDELLAQQEASSRL